MAVEAVVADVRLIAGAPLAEVCLRVETALGFWSVPLELPAAEAARVRASLRDTSGGVWLLLLRAAALHGRHLTIHLRPDANGDLSACMAVREDGVLMNVPLKLGQALADSLRLKIPLLIHGLDLATYGHRVPPPQPASLLARRFAFPPAWKPAAT
jgi:hypothetical protein